MNTFDHPPGQIRFGAYDAADVLPALAAAETEAGARLDAVAGSAEPLVALGEATARYNAIARTADDLAAVLGGPWPEVSRAANERVARFRARTWQRRDLYEAVRAVRPATAVEERLRTDLLRLFERSGAHLALAAQQRLADVNGRIAQLQADFMSNLRAVDAASGVRTDDPSGLPADLVDASRAAAQQRNMPGWWVPYSDHNSTIVRRDATDPHLRAAMYRLDITRAAKVNGPVVAETVALRQELAHLLGHEDFVAMQSAGRMVADPRAFLDELAAAYRPQADREYAELREFARTHTGDPTLELTAADLDNPMDGFYATGLKRARGLDRTGDVRAPLPVARQVMLDALSQLYGIAFAPAPDAPVWHEDVEVWDVHDGSTHLARIWCDWYARDGKDPGGWMTSPWLSTDGGPHLLGVVTNVPPGGATMHALRIMWHEFGHALHAAFAHSRYRLRSPNHMPHDFIEAPSQIMENWSLDPEILRRMGLDPEVAEAARAEDKFRRASLRMARMIGPAIDLALHRGEDPLAVKQRHLPVPVDPADATPAHLQIAMTNQYAAGYYVYQWAGVLTADLFTRFAAEGTLNPRTGRDYATKVLAPGAERDPNDLIRDFLGRDLRLDAALVRDGIKT